MATLSSELSGLTAEQKEAYLQGLNLDIGALDDFEVTSLAIATLTVTHMLAPRPYYERSDEEAPIATDSVRKGYAPTFTEFDFENGLEVTGKTEDLLQPGLLNEALSTFGALAAQAIIQAATDTTFNDAATATGPDGVTLNSASHPSTGGLQSNQVSSALDHTAAQSAERMLYATLGNDGQKLSFMPTALIVPSALMHTGAAIVAPGALLGTSGYAVANPQAGRFAVSVNRWLTSTTKWFLADGRMWRPRVNISRLPRPVRKEAANTARGFKFLDEFTLQTGYREWRGVVCGGS